MKRYDQAARRQSKRSGRETGCWVYIAGEDLAKSGVDTTAPPPAYRIWAGPRGRFIVTTYKER